MSLSSTNMAISETKGQGWRAILTQYRKASDILTSTNCMEAHAINVTFSQ